MSLDISNIIQVTARISPAGLTTANFGSCVIFADFSEKPASVSESAMNFYSSISDLAQVYPSSTEVYKAATVWFSTAPNPGKIQVYQMPNQDPDSTGSDTISVVDVLNEARESYWWYISVFNKNIYQAAVAGNASIFANIAAWGDANDSMIVNCVSGAALNDVLDPDITTDVCSTLKAQGTRHCFSLCSAAEYAGVSLAAHFASVNYSVQSGCITGEFKKLSTPADDFTATQYNTLNTKGAVYYTPVDSSGSVDSGRVIHSVTSSSYGEFIDNVFDLDSFINALETALYNVLTNQVSKLPQTPAGQQALLGAAKQVGQDYINNGYLGERKFTSTLTGEEMLSQGYEVLTEATDILDISESDRAQRKSAPILMSLYPANAIHKVEVTLDVY